MSSTSLWRVEVGVVFVQMLLVVAVAQADTEPMLAAR